MSDRTVWNEKGTRAAARFPRAFVLALAAAAALAAGCSKDATAPGLAVTLSATRRSVSFREDSIRVTTDSVAVGVTGPGAATAGWVATHGGGTWLTLTTAGGTGSGVVRWRRDATVLMAGATHVDTITVTVQGAGGATAFLVDSLTVRDAPAQYITVRRAWHAGERDSMAAYIARAGVMGEYSDAAAQAVLQEDSAVDIIVNPAWHAPAGMGAAGVERAPQIANGWSGRGLDLLVVFDSVPGGTIQRDSLDWISLRWWNPADSTWQGWMINGTAASTFAYQTVNTTAFNATGEHSGVGGGEARLASLTYWEANGGTFRVTTNGSYGTFSQIASGPYKGGDLAVGLMGGRLTNITMPRVLGADAPATQTFSVDFETSTLSSWRIICYFPPIPPVSPYHACTGSAAARLVAAARAHRLTAAMEAGVTDELLRPAARGSRTAGGGKRSR